MKEKFKIALAQINCNRGDKAANLQKMEEYARKAKEQNAELVIFPELSLTGYVLRDEIYELAEKIPGPSTSIMEKLAKEIEMHIVFGMPELSEKTEATVYNSAALIGPQGFIGKYRKMHLPTHSFFEEKRYFRPGYDVDVFETKLGKIGLIICYDIFFPEISRLARLKGAKLIICISASPAVRRAFFETYSCQGLGKRSLFSLCKPCRHRGWTAVLGRKQTHRPKRKHHREASIRRRKPIGE